MADTQGMADTPKNNPNTPGKESSTTTISTAASQTDAALLSPGREVACTKKTGGPKKTKNLMRFQNVVTELCLRNIASRTKVPHFTSASFGEGGARGIHYIGVEMALRFTGTKARIDHISGTSIGALFAAMSAFDLSIPTMQDMFQKFSTRLNCIQAALRVWRLPVNGYLFQTIDDFLKEGFGDKFEYTFQQLYDYNGRKLTLYTYDLEQFDLMGYSVDDHPNMRIIDAVYCSAAFPHLLPPRYHDGRRLIDGGIQHNVPIEQNGIAFELFLDRTGIAMVDAGIAIFRNLGGKNENVVKLNVCRLCYNVLFWRTLTMDEVKRITFETCREVLYSFEYHAQHGRFRLNPPATTRARVHNCFLMAPKIYVREKKEKDDGVPRSLSSLLAMTKSASRRTLGLQKIEEPEEKENIGLAED